MPSPGVEGTPRFESKAKPCCCASVAVCDDEGNGGGVRCSPFAGKTDAKEPVEVGAVPPAATDADEGDVVAAGTEELPAAAGPTLGTDSEPKNAWRL